MSSNDGSFNETVAVTFILSLVLSFKLILFGPTTSHPDDKIYGGILYTFLVSTGASFLEESLVSWIAATIILIFWGIVIALTIIGNWKVISNEDMPFSKGIQILVAIICVLLLVNAVKGIVRNFNS